MNDRTQVNINQPNRNRIPPWAWAVIAAATLALILGYLLFFNQPQQPAVTATPTLSPSPTTSVVEVTSTPNLLTPTATPLTVEVTPTPGSPTAVAPTVTPVLVEVTSTPGSATATPVAVATVTTTGATPAATTQASPQATLTTDEQSVLDALRAGTNGDRVTSVRYDGTDLTVDFQLTDGATAATAREQVRGMLVALSQNTLGYTNLELRGGTGTGIQENPPIQLTYDRNTVTTVDWSTVPEADVYGRAQSSTLQPPFDAP